MVVVLNPRTCGIYNNGGTRYKTDPATGRRTDEVDNELIEHVAAYLEGARRPAWRTSTSRMSSPAGCWSRPTMTGVTPSGSGS